MNEQERADWLARAIDDLIRGGGRSEPPLDLDEHDIDGLLRAAGHRLAAASDAAKSGLAHEGAVWREVIQRLDRRRQPRPGDPAYDSDVDAPPKAPDAEMSDLADIAEVRHKMAERFTDFAEAYREEVWRGLQERIERKDRKGLLSFLSKRARKRERHPMDRLIEGDPPEQYNIDADPEVAGLVSTAGQRRRVSRLAEALAEERREYIWDRVRSSVIVNAEHERERRRAAVRRLAAAGAAAALVVAALGPIPATGLAGHPAVSAVEFATEHLGVAEADSVPAVATEGEALTSSEASASEAASLLGAPIVAPEFLPGFTLASAQYFEAPVTAETGGAFVLTYSGSNPDQSLVVIQELASGADLSVAAGFATDVTLADGAPATYVEGAWAPAEGGELEWDADSAQTIVFERDGVRTTLRYTGTPLHVSDLVSLASNLR